MVDLTKACDRTAKLLENVRDEDFGARTPCEKLSVAELMAHIGGLAAAFAAAARKEFGPLTDTVPDDSAYRLDDDWRTRYPDELARLAAAWRAPEAWEGMTRIAGFDLPGEVAGMIALTEVVIHGWDLAQATGQPYDVDDADVRVVLSHVTEVAAEGPAEGLFGPAVQVPDDASPFDRALALSGRDPRGS
ncbi:TIGR03086 family metal-binding protein [Mycolicibacterium sp. HK-90]|uniref:TIGR03086 family metal-binding protein n=1 Tax=Mycolicibacterium sp. HK-90 TaxID=3056937 RepID=UPI0026588BAA|nr:TIGR03086 family metal-binding protein [Mycolicibacterium sp. HK-90]WKG03347.1 TIGR03086 family metal-binding protein [Mycolicibacterium sp. HK-90]